MLRLFPVEVSLLVEKRCEHLSSATWFVFSELLSGSNFPRFARVRLFGDASTCSNTQKNWKAFCVDQSDSRRSNSVHFRLGRTNDHLRATNGEDSLSACDTKEGKQKGHYKVICGPASIVSLLASLVLGAEDLATRNSTVSVPQW